MAEDLDALVARAAELSHPLRIGQPPEQEPEVDPRVYTTRDIHNIAGYQQREATRSNPLRTFFGKIRDLFHAEPYESAPRQSLPEAMANPQPVSAWQRVADAPWRAANILTGIPETAFDAAHHFAGWQEQGMHGPHAEFDPRAVLAGPQAAAMFVPRLRGAIARGEANPTSMADWVRSRIHEHPYFNPEGAPLHIWPGSDFLPEGRPAWKHQQNPFSPEAGRIRDNLQALKGEEELPRPPEGFNPDERLYGEVKDPSLYQVTHSPANDAGIGEVKLSADTKNPLAGVALANKRTEALPLSQGVAAWFESATGKPVKTHVARGRSETDYVELPRDPELSWRIHKAGKDLGLDPQRIPRSFEVRVPQDNHGGPPTPGMIDTTSETYTSPTGLTKKGLPGDLSRVNEAGGKFSDPENLIEVLKWLTSSAPGEANWLTAPGSAPKWARYADEPLPFERWQDVRGRGPDMMPGQMSLPVRKLKSEPGGQRGTVTGPGGEELFSRTDNKLTPFVAEGSKKLTPAVQVDGEIFEGGPTHMHSVQKWADAKGVRIGMLEKFGDLLEQGKAVEGYTTHDGKFIDRDQALEYTGAKRVFEKGLESTDGREGGFVNARTGDEKTAALAGRRPSEAELGYDVARRYNESALYGKAGDDPVQQWIAGLDASKKAAVRKAFDSSRGLPDHLRRKVLEAYGLPKTIDFNQAIADQSLERAVSTFERNPDTSVWRKHREVIADMVARGETRPGKIYERLKAMQGDVEMPATVDALRHYINANRESFGIPEGRLGQGLTIQNRRPPVGQDYIQALREEAAKGGTQSLIASRLKARGFTRSQASISRDITYHTPAPSKSPSDVAAVEAARPWAKMGITRGEFYRRQQAGEIKPWEERGMSRSDYYKKGMHFASEEEAAGAAERELASQEARVAPELEKRGGKSFWDDEGKRKAQEADIEAAKRIANTVMGRKDKTSRRTIAEVAADQRRQVETINDALKRGAGEKELRSLGVRKETIEHLRQTGELGRPGGLRRVPPLPGEEPFEGGAAEGVPGKEDPTLYARHDWRQLLPNGKTHFDHMVDELKAGRSINDVAQELGVTRQQVDNVLKYKGMRASDLSPDTWNGRPRKYTQEIVSKIDEMRAKGTSYQAIADELNKQGPHTDWTAGHIDTALRRRDSIGRMHGEEPAGPMNPPPRTGRAVSDKHLEALRLHHEEGMSLKEAAEKMGVPAGTLYTMRARERKYYDIPHGHIRPETREAMRLINEQGLGIEEAAKRAGVPADRLYQTIDREKAKAKQSEPSEGGAAEGDPTLYANRRGGVHAFVMTEGRRDLLKQLADSGATKKQMVDALHNHPDKEIMPKIMGHEDMLVPSQIDALWRWVEQRREESKGMGREGDMTLYSRADDVNKLGTSGKRDPEYLAKIQRALDLLKGGMSFNSAAREVGVNDRALRDWHKHLEAGGKLEYEEPPNKGRPLSPEDSARISQEHRRNAPDVQERPGARKGQRGWLFGKSKEGE